MVKRLTLAGLLAILLIPTFHMASCGGRSKAELCIDCALGDLDACGQVTVDDCSFDDGSGDF